MEEASALANKAGILATRMLGKSENLKHTQVLTFGGHKLSERSNLSLPATLPMKFTLRVELETKPPKLNKSCLRFPVQRWRTM